MDDQARRSPDEAQRQQRRPKTPDQQCLRVAGKDQPSALSPATLMHLQRQAGNAAVVRLLGAKRPGPSRVRCGPALQRVASSVQRDAKTGSDVLPAQVPGQQRKKPDWLAPDYADPLPGVPAPGYEALRYLRPFMPVQIPPIPPTGHAHIYTEADRENLKERLIERQKLNVASVGQFINNYIVAVVNVTGKYVSAEMRDAADAPGHGTLMKFLKFAMGETAEALLAGGVGVFLVKRLSKATVKALEFLAEKGTGYEWNEISGDDDKALQTKALDERQAFLNKLIEQVAKSTGQFAEGMINSLGEGEEVDRAYWLRGARLADLWRFRIPEAFPKAKPEALRSVVAGVVAGHAHTGEERTRKDCWGLQCATDTYHRHEIVVNVTPTAKGATIRSAQLNSPSKVLSDALAGSSIRMLPNMALYVAVDRVRHLKAAAKLMDAFRSPVEATLDEVTEFTEAYPAARSPGRTIVTRTPTGVVQASSGGMADALWYYQLATGDYSLATLANEIVPWQEEAQEDEGGDGPQSRPADPAGLAKLTHLRLEGFRDEGARRLIQDFLGDAAVRPASGIWSKGLPMKPGTTTPDPGSL